MKITTTNIAKLYDLSAFLPDAVISSKAIDYTSTVYVGLALELAALNQLRVCDITQDQINRAQHLRNLLSEILTCFTLEKDAQ